MDLRKGNNTFCTVLPVVVVLLAAFTCGGCGKTGGGKSDEFTGKEMDREISVIKGGFNITINLEGTLDAIKRHYITCPEKVRYGLEIIEIATNQLPVKQGATVVRFAPQKYLERERELSMQIDDERKNFSLAQEDSRMQAAGNIASLKDSADKVKQTQEAYDRYLEEDAPFTKKKFQAAIALAGKNLEKSRKQLSDSRGLLAKAQMQTAEQLAALNKQIEEGQKAEDAARTELNKAQYDLRMFKQYDHPEKLRTLATGLTKASMDMKNNVVQAASKLLQARRKEGACKKRMDDLQREMEELYKMMRSLEIKAPVDGIFTIGDERRNRHYYGDNKEVIVGAQMNPNEVIGSIPELSKFLTSIKIPELYRSKIRLALPATLTVKAIPGLVMTGTVSKIASMAMSSSPWDDSGPKQYNAEISIDKVDPRLMPGMTMQVEIIVDTVGNALHVPVEALYAREGHVYCRVKTSTGTNEREVKKGRSSDDQIEILSGLAEGEMVLVHRPATAKEDGNP